MRQKRRNGNSDAEVFELLQMYFIIKGMCARLLEIEEAHPLAEQLKKVLNKAIIEMEDSAHLLYKEMWEIKHMKDMKKKIKKLRGKKRKGK